MKIMILVILWVFNKVILGDMKLFLYLFTNYFQIKIDYFTCRVV